VAKGSHGTISILLLYYDRLGNLLGLSPDS